MKIKKINSFTRSLTAVLVPALACVFLFTAGDVYANSYGVEITKNDGIGTNGSGEYKEDNEAEPGMVQSQAWDLEGFFLDRTAAATKLTIVGGFNFYTGYEKMAAGDIFIDTNGDAIFSPNTIPGYNYNPGYQTVSNSYFNYDYVLDIDWASETYDIVQLTSDSLLKDTKYGASYNTASNPWIYQSGGTVISGSSPLSFDTYGKVSQTDTGFLNWGSNTNHYVATFDITGLTLGHENYFHNTMECGNDNLIGYTHLPEPATMLLFGVGLAGMGLTGVRRKIKA